MKGKFVFSKRIELKPEEKSGLEKILRDLPLKVIPILNLDKHLDETPYNEDDMLFEVADPQAWNNDRTYNIALAKSLIYKKIHRVCYDESSDVQKELIWRETDNWATTIDFRGFTFEIYFKHKSFVGNSSLLE